MSDEKSDNAFYKADYRGIFGKYVNLIHILRLAVSSHLFSICKMYLELRGRVWSSKDVLSTGRHFADNLESVWIS